MINNSNTPRWTQTFAGWFAIARLLWLWGMLWAAPQCFGIELSLPIPPEPMPAADQAPRLYPGDGSKDSAPAIAEYIKEAKPLPAGSFYIHSTIDTGIGVGGGLIGNGRHDFARANSAWKGKPCTVIIDMRHSANAEPILRIRRGAFRLQDVGLIGCYVNPPPQHNTDIGAGPAIEVTQLNPDGTRVPWPVGQVDIERLTITNSDVGIITTDDGTGGGHGDHINATYHTDSVNYPFVCDDNQSVDHHLKIFASGNGKYCIWAKEGGKITARIHTNGHWDRWLAVGQIVRNAEGKIVRQTSPTKNNGFYSLTVDADGGDRVGSPFEELRAYKGSRPVVTIRGVASSSAVIAGDPILLNRSKVRVFIDRSAVKPYVWKSQAAIDEDAEIGNWKQ